MKSAPCARFATLAVLLCCCAQSALAKEPDPAVLPAGNMTMIVPLAAGGPTDALARIVANKLGPRLGRAIIIENKGGAGGNIGAAAAAKAAPNGLTALFTIDSVLTINPFLYASQGFDPQKDLAPVSIVGRFALTLVINAKIPAQNWADLVAYSKTRSLNFGSAGFGSPPHLAFEYLKWVSKLDATHVPYKGAGPLMTELLAGNVDGSFVVSGAVIKYVQAGSLRALAVSSPKRLATLPSVPTAAETGIPDFEARFGNLVLVPAQTPPAVKELLSKEIAEVLKDPDIRARFAALETEPVGSTVAEAQTWVTNERARWGKVIKETGIKLPQ